MSKKINIAIADDHTLFRQSVSMAFKSVPDFDVVIEVENGRQLLDAMLITKPDIVLLDLQMPVLNGWDALTNITQLYPHCKVIVVSMFFEELLLKDLTIKGARGFIPKNSDFETLINAIYEVNHSGYYFSKKVSKALVEELVKSKSINPNYKEVKLSQIEIETLIQICADKNIKEIADALHVSERTIERYRSSIFEKTKTKTVAGLVLFAIKNKLINYFRNPDENEDFFKD